jgi:histone-lysine N-methyltransferase SETMAR
MEKEEYRIYIKERVKQSIPPIAIHEELKAGHRGDAPSYSTVCYWASRFRREIMSIKDLPREGRPVTRRIPQNVELVRKLIEKDPHCTYDDLEAMTTLSRGVLETIIHDELRMKKVTSRWVPHKLTRKQRQKRVEYCKANLRRFQSRSFRMSNLVTGDETWIYFRQVGRKASNAAWKGEDEYPETIVKKGISEERRLYSIFFKDDGWLLVNARARGRTIDRFYYLNNCLKPLVKVIRKLRPKTGTRDLFLLHDNAPPHTNQLIRNYLRRRRVKLIPHPGYSPDLSPCDFWLNDYLKRQLHDHETEKSLFREVTRVLKRIPVEEYKKTFRKLKERMKLCIQHGGDYFDYKPR